jgi:hypothetical protein
MMCWTKNLPEKDAKSVVHRSKRLKLGEAGSGGGKHKNQLIA